MKRVHYAILAGQVLSYSLIITFIFADMTFDLTSVFRVDGTPLSPSVAIAGACLIGMVGATNVWITYFYMQKSHTMRDWVVICAWTHRVKTGNRWMTIEDFLAETLGCQISHGLSEEAYHKLAGEVDGKWQNLQFNPRALRDVPLAPEAGGEASAEPAV